VFSKAPLSFCSMFARNAAMEKVSQKVGGKNLAK
jgi:hypothetical protein